MNFNSLAFLIFLPIAVGFHWLLPHRARKYWLLAASWFFYMYWNPLFIFLLLFSTAVDYFCGRGMARWREQKRIKRLLLSVSMVMNLGLLFFFKYWDFFGGIMNGVWAALGLSFRTPELNLILPVGISFYTFQTMSYTIDVYRGKFEAEKDFVTFALYVSFFPQLVAGPIEAPGNLLPQLKKERRFQREDVSAGLRLLLCGFFRKCAVADLCGVYVNRVFAQAEQASSFAIFLAGALFCFQMYCDFAGYSEIAAGSARLMGIRLMKNFDQPYLSQSYGEFFRRWHISLNRWFTSYVYIPLGGSRRGTARRMANTLIVFALCGLWHGARWNYVLWGLYAALWVCVEGLLEQPTGRLAEKWRLPLSAPWFVWLRRGIMFLIFVPAGLIFRASSLEQVGVVFHRLLNAPGSAAAAMQSMNLTGLNALRLILTLLAMARLRPWGEGDLPGAKTGRDSARKMVSAVYFLLIIACAWLALLATQDAAEFAYFQF